MLVKIHVIIRGTVQGVGYRYFSSRTAQAFGLVGWVRNLADGTVELWAEGPVDKVTQLETWCREGPPNARVDGIKLICRETISQISFSKFEIRP